jgi:predicted nicotinamide N-methyase
MPKSNRPPGRQRKKRPLERQAFGLTILDVKHPEIRQLREQGVQPSLHGEKVWRASFVLMDYLQQRRLKPGVSVLEIGCGWGLVGIYCAKMFQAQVTGFDADAAVFPYLQLHAQRNGVHIDTLQGVFTQVTPQELAPFDLILGADICFWDELAEALEHLIQQAITAGVAEILVADPDRPPFDELCTRCTAQRNAEVFDWEITTPMAVSGRILRVVGVPGARSRRPA